MKDQDDDQTRRDMKEALADFNVQRALGQYRDVIKGAAILAYSQIAVRHGPGVAANCVVFECLRSATSVYAVGCAETNGDFSAAELTKLARRVFVETHKNMEQGRADALH